MMRRLSLVPGVLALALAACSSSPPVNYYTLLAPSAARPSDEQPASFLIEVLPVGLPEQLDQAALIVRQGESGIAVLDGERWAGPLGDELRTALSAELGARLATRDVAGLAKPGNKSVLRIKVEVRRFDIWPGQNLVLDADWSLGFANAADNSRLLCHGRFAAPASGGAGQLALAGQQTVAALAARIAADARGWALASPSACRK